MNLSTDYDRAKAMASRRPRHTLAVAIWFGYLFFIVYGSLVPLDFRSIPLDQAWAIFQHIPMYKLGVESRADWIANGVLYVPAGFLTAHIMLQKFSESSRPLLYLLSALLCISLAFDVEFTQIFFPPRSVSLNDLLAESVGSLIGLLLAAKYSDWFKILLQTAFREPRRLALRLVEAYLVTYVAFSLFPYDILLSGAELEQKLRGDNWGWLLAGDLHEKIRVTLKLLSEIVLTLPFGLFLGYRSSHRTASFLQAALLGALLGGFIEFAQFFTASGVSQGLSVLTRIAGACGGLVLWQRRADWSPEKLAALAQRFVLPLGIAYLVILLQVNGWLSHRWNGVDFAVSRFGELHFLPFYYHYFTTEAKALFSLASVCFMYLPFGLLIWSSHGSPTGAFFLTLIAACLIETGKLFLQGLHPDPTNVLLGAFAAWGTVHLANEMAKAAVTSSNAKQAGMSRTAPPDDSLAANKAANGTAKTGWRSYIVLLPSLSFVAYWAATFPTQPVLLCLLLAACAAIVWQRPVLLLAIIPTALPILDLAPWSGRFYLDEFDLLLLTTLSIGFARTMPAQHGNTGRDFLFSLASLLIGLSLAIGAVHSLTPWQTPDANAFTSYYSPFNALRIGKGALWAFLAYGLLRRFAAAYIDLQRPLAIGMVGGLALTVIVILWERQTFTHMFDFASDYRVTGPFSSMHMGGAYIECFLAVAAPFLILLIVQTGRRVGRALGTLLLLAATYALMVTFSRNGYSAFGIALAIILLFSLFKSGQRQKRGILVVTLCIAVLAAALPVFTGQFARERMATVGKDFALRQAHWEDALNMRSPDWLTILFGMGLGRYPESHYLLSREGSHAGTYQLQTENGNTFLRLGGGEPIYVEQIVPIRPYQSYVLKLNVRTNRPDEQITAALCEKWMLTSFKCVHVALKQNEIAGDWKSVEAPFASSSLGDSPWYAGKPVKFALNTPHETSYLDIDNIRLETIGGDNLLSNGDFSGNLDHWFFSADNHLQWHAKSLPIAALFDLGWFGLAALSLFSVLAIKRAAGRAWQGDLHAAAALAAFCGFLVVGLFDTLIDAPRFLFLLLLLGWFCGIGNSTGIKDQQNG